MAMRDARVFKVVAPINMFCIEEQVRPTRYSVAFPNRNVVVEMKVRRNDVSVIDRRIDKTKPRQGCVISWTGSTKEFRALFSPGLSEVDLRESFRRYVLAWYAHRGELVA